MASLSAGSARMESGIWLLKKRFGGGLALADGTILSVSMGEPPQGSGGGGGDLAGG